MSVRKGGQVIAEVADLSSYAKDANVVHTNTADNNIQGQKTFKSNIICEATYNTKLTSLASNTTIPSGTDPARSYAWLANDGTILSQIYYQRVRDSGLSRFLMRLYDPTGGSYRDFQISNGGSGQRYINLPESPAQSDNSTKVATTNWVKNYAMGLPDWNRKWEIAAGTAVSANGYVYAYQRGTGDQDLNLTINGVSVGGASTGHYGNARSGLCAVAAGDVVSGSGRGGIVIMYLCCKNL